MKLNTILKAAMALSIVGTVLPSVAGAQSAADFYKGKKIRLLVGSGAGGGYDAYARGLANHWGRNIPGQPKIIVQNMPGAGGVKMFNHLANKAKKDGTVIGASFAGNLIEPIFDKGKGTKYDPRKMGWIGSISPQYNGCFVRKESPVKTIADAKKHQVIMAATSSRSNSAVMANIWNIMIGTKFKVVTGYSTTGTTMAMERGEADGTCLSHATMLARLPHLIEKKLITWLIVMHRKEVPELPGVPPATSFTKNDEERQVIELFIARNLMGRPFVAPAGIPADRLTALRDGFFKTMKDPAFLKDAKRLKLVVDPSDHKTIEKTINDAYAIPPAIAEKAINLMKGAKAMAKKAPKVKKQKK